MEDICEGVPTVHQLKKRSKNNASWGGDVTMRSVNFLTIFFFRNLAAVNKDRFRFEPISEFVYICKIDQSHYVI